MENMDYDLLCRQLEEFIKEDSFYIPVLSNASALLFETPMNT